jgi:hypothetical protein
LRFRPFCRGNGKDIDALRLAIVEDREVFFREVGYRAIFAANDDVDFNETRVDANDIVLCASGADSNKSD